MIIRNIFFVITTFLILSCLAQKIDFQNRGSHGEDSEEEEDEQLTDKKSKSMYEFLYKRMNQEVVAKKRLPANVYTIPGPQEPLPGRSHMGDYWPVFPFQNQYSGGLDLDPSISRHIGGDLNLAVPSWGVLDIYGRFFNRIHDTTTKIGYMNHPVNMMDLEKEDLVQLMSDPSLSANRNAHPTLPVGKMAKSFVPMSCKPPMCNPYHMNFGLGIEQDFGGNDGVEGDIDVPMPISKGMAYRFPFSGKIYAARENLTVTYGQNLSPIEPFSSLFDYQKHRDPALRIPRRWTRSIPEPDMMDHGFGEIPNPEKNMYGANMENYVNYELFNYPMSSYDQMAIPQMRPRQFMTRRMPYYWPNEGNRYQDMELMNFQNSMNMVPFMNQPPIYQQMCYHDPYTGQMIRYNTINKRRRPQFGNIKKFQPLYFNY